MSQKRRHPGKKPLIVLGITGSIAAVRAFDLCRELRRNGFDVQVLLSDSARQMVTEQAMEFASCRKVISSISGKVEHVKFFGKRGSASLLLVAPATANTISKIAMGIDDTPITTFATIAIGSGKPVLLAPAMHEPMYEHPIVRENLAKLEGHGVKVIAPLMQEGKAKLADIEGIVFEVERALRSSDTVCSTKTKNAPKLAGKKVLVASGAFSEKIDEVRVITNLSSGKMGSAIAVACALDGAEVKMVGNGAREPFIDFEDAHTADELEEKVLKALGARDAAGRKGHGQSSASGYDYFFCPAAIPDFTIKTKKSAGGHMGKIDSGGKVQLELVPRKKMLVKIRAKFPGLKIIAFKAEWGKSKNGIEKAAEKFRRENGFYAVVANDLKKSQFGSDETEVFFCRPEKKWLKGEKKEAAKWIARLIG